MAPAGLKPFQLLEINIISAQDLEPVSKKMRTYAKAWVHTNRKLSSCVDNEGNNNPTWNDKFVFRVDEEFLQEDTSAVMIEIYAMHWFRDTIVGTVRVLVGNLIPPPVRSRRHGPLGMRFVALQVRRPSGRPQGILNIGVALLDSSMRSMPLYKLGSAVGYRDLMQDPPALQQLQRNDNNNNNDNNDQAPDLKPILRRSRSERSERMAFDNFSPSSSMVGVPKGNFGDKDSSILSISVSAPQFITMKNKGKASSVINGAELREKPQQKGKKSKASSVVNALPFSKKEPKNEDNEKSVKGAQNVKPRIPIPGRPIPKYDHSAPKMPLSQGKYLNIGGGPFKANSILSDSEVGPSPSEVAAAMAQRRYPLEQDNESSVLDGWSMDESVEGLKSKLERWRMELPPVYDHDCSSTSYKSSNYRSRKQNSGGSGLFSCFGNICGYECQCVCGKPLEKY